MNNENILKNETEGSDLSDKGSATWTSYIVGLLCIVISTIVLILVGWFYWELHGGDINKFSFWIEGDKKWLEVLFWSFFTVLAWNITDIAGLIYDGKFKRGDALGYLGHLLETPPISLALVLIIINLGISFGNKTVSLSEAPISVVIAFSIISAYFSRETVEGVQSVAKWLSNTIKDKFHTDDVQTDNRPEESESSTIPKKTNKSKKD